MSNLSRSNFQGHPFHLVSPSPWPAITTLSLFLLTVSWSLSMYGYMIGTLNAVFALLLVIGSMSFWFRDVISEGTYLGNHTSAVQKGLSMGMALFIASETLFFLGIFWAFFHSALSPTIEMGSFWPPEGVDSIDSMELPLLNTMLLLASGLTVTYAHHSLLEAKRAATLKSLALTVALALLFTDLQVEEYMTAPFSISDGTFGCCFFLSTGFHGLHVVIGTAFIFVGLWRVLSYHFTTQHHVGFESGILYWHFVDVVWLYLLLSVYYWGA